MGVINCKLMIMILFYYKCYSDHHHHHLESHTLPRMSGGGKYTINEYVIREGREGREGNLYCFNLLILNIIMIILSSLILGSFS